MARAKPVVLVVDRESDATKELIAFLRAQEFEVIWARDGESAFNVLDDTPVDCLITELRAERIDGLNLVRRARERSREICAIAISEGVRVEAAVEAMRLGAYDVQTHPLNLERLLAVLERGLSHQALAARASEMEGQLDERLKLERLTGRSRAIQRVMDQVRNVAPVRSTVLIEGEPGTGKSIVAQAIHRNSPRRTERFAWVHCGTLAEGTIESELFGHEGGSSGPSAPRRGRFELADGGTLFLDEIGETPPAAQMKLVRVLQDRAFERVGGNETIKVDVRLVAATSRDLAGEVEAGRFREDLYVRLGVVRIRIPALRERSEDIPILVQTFIRELNREHGRKVTGVTPGLLDRLMRCSWPGNVRELRNTIERMVMFADGRRPLELSDLPEALRELELRGEALSVAAGMRVEEAERLLIAATLRHTGNDKPRAAAMLGIGLRTLYRKIRQYSVR